MEPRAERGPPTPQASLGKLLAGFVAMMGVVGLAIRLPPLWGLLVLALGLAVLGLAAWEWGVDSRDGKDWKEGR